MSARSSRPPPKTLVTHVVKPPLHPVALWMRQNQVTQTEISKTFKMSQGYISDILSWKRPPPPFFIVGMRKFTGEEITEKDWE